MTRYNKYLLLTTALIGISTSIPAYAANSYQEVAERNSAILRAQETIVPAVKKSPILVPSSFQEVVDRNSAILRAGEMAEVRVEDRTVSSAASSFQDVVKGDRS